MNDYVGNLYNDIEIESFNEDNVQFDNIQKPATICLINVGGCGKNFGSCGAFIGGCRKNSNHCWIDGGFYLKIVSTGI